ncbi:MAG: glycosyltransferase [Patescibacteria group bacterium]|nr:glycosyltransferase [Patescibacteria group bacterium]
MKKELKGKKILYLITQSKWGGAQKYVIDLARHFSQKNEVHIAYGESRQLDPYFAQECQKLKVKTIPLPYLCRNIDLGKDYLAMIDLSKLFGKESYDLIHLNSSKAGLLGSLAAKYYGLNLLNAKLRLIYTAHGFVFNEPLSKFRKKIYKLSETFSTTIQHLIIAVSDADRQSAIENKITHPAKIFTVHNGLDFSQYDFYPTDQARQKLGLEKDQIYFGTIASFYLTKGHTYLLDAVKELRTTNWPLFDKSAWVFIGDGPEKENISQKIKAADLQDKIKVFDPSPEGDHKYLKAFDYFILPSVKEGLPYTILEAGLAQVPVVATRVGGLPEIITDKKNGLLATAANPLSLADKIKKISADQKMSSALAQANYQNIKSNFSLDKTLSQTEELYLKLF